MKENITANRKALCGERESRRGKRKIRIKVKQMEKEDEKEDDYQENKRLMNGIN
jgi:hypothetical protein